MFHRARDSDLPPESWSSQILSNVEHGLAPILVPTAMMLLYVSSGAADQLGRVPYDREDLAGNIAFEAADDLALTQPLSGAAKHVCPGAGIVTKPNHDDAIESGIRLAVASAV